MATRRTKDQRGSAEDRRVRKHKLLWRFGDGTTCPCVHCNKPLTFETLQQDRIVPGGSYAMSNLQPSCESCNLLRAHNIEWGK